MRKRIASIGLSVCLCFALLSTAAFAVESAGGAPAEESDVLETAYLGTVSLGTGISLFSTDTNKAPLKDGVGVKWIDRLDLTGNNAWGATFYQTLEGAVDNDGIKDYLIDDKYFKGAVDDDGDYWTTGSGYYLLKVTDYSNTDEVAQKEQLMTAVYGAFLRDHPEVFWLSGDIGMANITNNLFFVLKGGGLDARATDYQSADTIKDAITTQNEKVTEILGGTTITDRYELVQYFNNKLTTTNQYNTTALGEYPASARRGLTALQGGTGTDGPICEGYSKAFKILCDQKNIPCVLVAGNSHMWNYVQMDNGKWYAVDVTWNDPVSSDESTVGANSGNETENYLLVGSDTVIGESAFSVGHPVENAMFNDSEYKYTNGPTIETAKYDPSTAGKVDQVIDAEPVTVTYGETEKFVGADVASADDKVTAECGALSYEVTSGTDVISVDEETGELTIKKAGTATVTVTAADTDDYNEATKNVTVTVNKRTAKLEWQNVTGRYWNDGLTVTAEVTNKVDGDDVSVTVSNGGGTTPHESGAGYLATATGLTGKDAGNYQLPESVTQTYRIYKANYTGTKAYQGSSPYGNNGEVDLSTCIAEGTETLTVDVNKITDSDSVLSGTPTVSSNKLLFTFANDAEKIDKTATVRVQVSGQYYNNYEITVTLTVSDRLEVPVVQPNPINQVYTGSYLTNADITGTASVAGTWSWYNNSAPFRVTPTADPFKVVFTPNDPKYKPTEATVYVTITKAPVTITGLTVEDKTYDGTTKATVSGTPSIVGLKNESDNVTVSSEDSSAEFESKEAGEGKTVVFSGYSLGGTQWGNYELTGQPTATATIKPKEVTVSGVTAVDRTYNETYTVTLSNGTVEGAVAGDDVTVDLTDAVGTVSDNSASETPRDVTVSGVKLSGADAGNYTLTAQPTGVTVTISKNQQTITAPAVTATYGDTGVKVVPSGTHGTVSYAVTTGDCVSVDNDGNVTLLKAGTATITVTAAGNEAYAVGTQTVTVTVNKRVISVKANDKSMTVNGTLPTFDVTYGNFAAGDTKESVIATEATASVAADGKTTGSFDITVTANATLKDGMAEKYEFGTAEKGTLTVNAAPAPSPSPSTGGGSSSGGSSGGGSSSGNTVTVPVSSDNASVEVKAEVSKGNATVEVSDKQIEQVANDGAGEVTVDVSGLKNVDSATVPSHVVEKTNEAENTGLTVALPTGSVTLDETALESVTENANGKDVTISVVSIPTASLSPVVKDLIGMEPTVAAVVDVNITVGGAKQSSFDGGKVTISIPYTPKKGEDTSKLTVWFIKDDGTIENKGGWYDAENKCFVFETDHLSQYLLVNTNELVTFTDVPASAYFYNAVNWAAAQGITGGVDATHFMPHNACTRAQIVTFLYRWAVANGVDVSVGEDTNILSYTDAFDVPEYAIPAFQWAVGAGILQGNNGNLMPDQTCTRAQAVAFLFRFAQSTGMDVSVGEDTNILSYNDAFNVPEYAIPAFQWAVGAGIVQGNDGNLMPNQTCTRAQIVTMLYRLLGE